MSDWMHDPEVVQASAAFSRARKSWLAVVGPGKYLDEEMTPDRRAMFHRMRKADRAYVWARNGALQRHLAAWSQPGRTMSPVVIEQYDGRDISRWQSPRDRASLITDAFPAPPHGGRPQTARWI